MSAVDEVLGRLSPTRARALACSPRTSHTRSSNKLTGLPAWRTSCTTSPSTPSHKAASFGRRHCRPSRQRKPCTSWRNEHTANVATGCSDPLNPSSTSWKAKMMNERMGPSEAHALIYGNYPMEDDSDPMVTPYNESQGWVVQMGTDSYTNDMPDAPYEDAKMLAHATRALRTIVAVGKAVDYIEKSHPQMTREQYVRADPALREVNNEAQEILQRLKEALGLTEEDIQ